MLFNNDEWSLIEKIIFAIHSESDITKLRSDFLQAVNELIPHEKSFFDLGYKHNAKVVFYDPITTTISEDNLTLFFNEYIFADTMFWFFSQSESCVYRESDYISEIMRGTSEFYKGWLRPQDLYYSMGSTIVYGPLLYGSVNLWRSQNHGDFSDNELEILRILNKHLSLHFHRLHPLGISKNQNKNITGTLRELYHLSKREDEIANLIYEGHNIKEIGDMLFISESTVKKHSHNIFCKVKINSRSQLIKVIHQNLDDAP